MLLLITAGWVQTRPPNLSVSVRPRWSDHRDIVGLTPRAAARARTEDGGSSVMRSGPEGSVFFHATMTKQHSRTRTMALVLFSFFRTAVFAALKPRSSSSEPSLLGATNASQPEQLLLGVLFGSWVTRLLVRQTLAAALRSTSSARRSDVARSGRTRCRWMVTGFSGEVLFGTSGLRSMAEWVFVFKQIKWVKSERHFFQVPGVQHLFHARVAVASRASELAAAPLHRPAEACLTNGWVGRDLGRRLSQSPRSSPPGLPGQLISGSWR